ncbi:RNA polymerase sigma factor [Streptomyces sp. NPDC050400]|uniref:RNA polymerase sigma factor n=1 Tax=Streptomyces sp. NPDC050400 TaxID=3365610 RepID=UPI0037907709
MTSQPTPYSPPPARALAGVQLPAAFWAFHSQYYAPYQRYAHLQLGSKAEADRLVHQVFLYIAVNWSSLMRQERPHVCAWNLLKHRVAVELESLCKEPAMAQTAVFDKVTRAALEGVRSQLAVMESALGVYGAIANLPDRQFDVMVLRFVLGHTTKQTAAIMGVDEATVRSHCFRARKALADDLNLPLKTPRDHEE